MNRLRAAVVALAAMAVAVGVNLAAAPMRVQADLTDARIFSLTDGTRELLGSLPEPVSITAYFGSLPARFVESREYVEAMLAQYAEASGGKLTWRHVDPANDAALQTELAERKIEPTIVLELAGDERVQRKAYFALELVQGERREVWRPPNAELAVEALEHDLTTRVRRLAVGRKRVGITTGFGEPLQTQVLVHPESQFGTVWDVRAVDWKADPSQAQGFDALVVNGPTEPVSPEAVAALEAHVVAGRPVVFMLGGIHWTPGGGGPGKDRPLVGVPVEHGLEPVLARWGLAIEKATVLDPENGVPGLVPIGQPPLLSKLFFPLARVESVARARYAPLENLDLVPVAFASPVTATPVPGVELTPLLRSFETSIAKPGAITISRDNRALTTADAAEGPFVLAYAARTPNGRVVVVGSSAMIADQTFVMMREVGNRALLNGFEAFAGMLSWALEDTTLTGARGKTVARPIGALSEGERAWIKWGNMLGAPLCVLAIGLLVGVYQRHARRRAHF